METGLNKELAKKLKERLQIKAEQKVIDSYKPVEDYFNKKKSSILNKGVDAQGNVVRDFKSELELYDEFDYKMVLPCLKPEYFDGHKKFSTHATLNAMEGVLPAIKEVKLARIPLSRMNRIVVFKRLITIQMARGKNKVSRLLPKPNFPKLKTVWNMFF